MDDVLIVGQEASKIGNMKKEFSKSFAINDLGLTKQILDMKISRDRKAGKLWLYQEAYIEMVLIRFNMGKAKYVCSLLASHFKLSSEYCPISEKELRDERSSLCFFISQQLMYAMVYTIPDIAFAIAVVTQFLSNSGKENQIAMKWILRHLRGTSKACLCFSSDKSILQVYVDADMA